MKGTTGSSETFQQKMGEGYVYTDSVDVYMQALNKTSKLANEHSICCEVKRKESLISLGLPFVLTVMAALISLKCIVTVSALSFATWLDKEGLTFVHVPQKFPSTPSSTSVLLCKGSCANRSGCILSSRKTCLYCASSS